MHTLARKKLFGIGALALALALAVAFAGLWLMAGDTVAAGKGGNPASNKAVFSTNAVGVTFTEFVPAQNVACAGTGFEPPSAFCTPFITLFNLVDALKTSTQGALEAEVSLECLLLTDSSAIAEIAATGTGAARAGIEVRVLFDGVVANPGNVVFCDRLQHLELTVPGLVVGGDPVTSTAPFIIRLFQRTESAHSFNFYQGLTDVTLHDIKVEVRGIIQCSKDGAAAACSDVSVTFQDISIGGGTKVAIGTSTLVVEEQQNFAELPPQ